MTSHAWTGNLRDQALIKSTWEIGFYWDYSLPTVSTTITKHAVNSTVLQASIATFSCDASGEPTPEFYWTHNGKNISDGGKYSLTNNNKNLAVSSLVYNDRGVYTCFAFNVVNEVKTSANLTVLGKFNTATRLWLWHVGRVASFALVHSRKN